MSGDAWSSPNKQYFQDVEKVEKSIRVRLSLPGLPQGSNLQQFNRDSNSTIFQVGGVEVEFFINDSQSKVDFWFVIEDVEESESFANLPPEKIFFLAAETATSEDFYVTDKGMESFLNQFGRVYSHGYWPKPNHYPSAPFLPWMFLANHGESILQPTPDRGLLWGEDESKYQKGEKLFSMFCSSQSMSPMHKVRLNFAERLSSEYPDLVDWFGNGVRALDRKADVIVPYKYHIALENKRQNNVVSEKLLDSFLGLALPLYFGAPNVHEFFDPRSLIEIDIMNFSEVARTIERLAQNDPFEQFRPFILESRRKVLDNNFAYRMAQIAVSAEAQFRQPFKAKETIIRSRKNFVVRDSVRYKFARWIYFRFFSPS